MAARSLLVYAVCAPPRLPVAGTGMSGEPLTLVEAAGLAAVAGEVQRPPRATLAAMRRYDAVLQSLAHDLPALLPARFGTCMGSAEDLALVLRARGAALRKSLQEVRGRVQMTLRSVEAEAAREGPPADRSSGLAYLRTLAAERRSAHEAPALAPVLAAVARWVRAQQVVRSGRVASVYHLIPRGSVQAYQKAAQRAAAASGARVVLTGPFPPYAFGGA